MTMKVGSLCTGIGGLDLAVEEHFGATLEWYSEIEKAPCVVLEREWPGVPNLGDLKVIDWGAVPAVDILTAGYPCQPFSYAGLRKGTDDPRHLWPFIADAVRRLRPRYVVLENVQGHLSKGFDVVLADLAEAGFDAEWCLLRASDVGACHRRARVFIVATNTDGRRARWDGGAVSGTPEGARRPYVDLHSARHDRAGVADADGEGPQGAGELPSGRGSRPADGSVAPANASSAARREPQLDGVAAPARSAAEPRERVGESADGGGTDWGKFAGAIARHELNFGRPAPSPTDGGGRLSPDFVGWMQCYPPGWHGDLKRTASLKAYGNAVVPPQALAALRILAPLGGTE